MRREDLVELAQDIDWLRRQVDADGVPARDDVARVLDTVLNVLRNNAEETSDLRKRLERLERAGRR